MMEDVDSAYGIKSNLEHYIKQAEYHLQYLESYGASAQQAHRALSALREAVDSMVNEITENSRQVESNKKVGRYNKEKDWNEKYKVASELYYIGDLDNAELTMRHIAAAGLEKINPELHKCALKSIEEIDRAKILREHSGA